MFSSTHDAILNVKRKKLVEDVKIIEQINTQTSVLRSYPLKTMKNDLTFIIEVISFCCVCSRDRVVVRDLLFFVKNLQNQINIIIFPQKNKNCGVHNMTWKVSTTGVRNN